MFGVDRRFFEKLAREFGYDQNEVTFTYDRFDVVAQVLAVGASSASVMYYLPFNRSSGVFGTTAPAVTGANYQANFWYGNFRQRMRLSATLVLDWGFSSGFYSFENGNLIFDPIESSTPAYNTKVYSANMQIWYPYDSQSPAAYSGLAFRAYTDGAGAINGIQIQCQFEGFIVSIK